MPGPLASITKVEFSQMGGLDNRNAANAAWAGGYPGRNGMKVSGEAWHRGRPAVGLPSSMTH